MRDQPLALVGSVWQFQTQSHSTSECITISGRSLKQALSIKSHCSDKTKQEQHRILIDWKKKVEDRIVPEINVVTLSCPSIKL